jgi:spermidine synthase
MSRGFQASLVGMGLTALLTQVILTRELLASFYGNELSIGLILVDWLLLVALGAGLAGRLASRLRLGYGAFAATQALLAVLLPFSVYVARRIGGGSAFPGQVIGPLPTLYLAGMTLLPCCAILGAQFGLACVIVARPHVPETGPEAGGAAQVGRIYVLEAGGAVVGGLLFHFWLAGHVQSMAALGAVGAVNAALAVWLTLEQLSAARRAALVALAASVGLAVAVAALVPRFASALERASLRARWRGYQLVDATNSRYGALAVTKSGSQLSFFHDGLLAFTTEDELANEELAHLSMLEAPDPQRVLFISGGLGGALGEVLKHGVQSADYVELDSREIELAARYVPPALASVLRDPRVHIHPIDGRVFVRRASPHSYDVAIVNVPDPSTGMLNRFYTEEFFREIARVLSPRGIVCVDLTTAEAGPTGERRLLYASVLKALKAVFPDVAVIVPVTKSRALLFGCPQAGVLSQDPDLLADRLRERGVTGAFVSPGWVGQQMLPQPAWDLFVMSVDAESDAATNRDFRPVSYQYWLRLWLRQYSPRAAEALAHAGSWAKWVWAAPALALLLALTVGLRWRRYDGATVIGLLAGIGFIEMGLQLMVLFSFQIVAGYLFYQIGILTTLFMAGLAIGGEIGRRIVRHGGRAVAVAFAGCLPGLLLVCGAMPWLVGHAPGGTEALKVVIGAISLVIGALGGLAYAPAVRLATAHAGEAGRAGAGLYAADLVGGALGAILVSVLVLPALGLWATCHGLAILSAAGVILAVPLIVRTLRTP